MHVNYYVKTTWCDPHRHTNTYWLHVRHTRMRCTWPCIISTKIAFAEMTMHARNPQGTCHHAYAPNNCKHAPALAYWQLQESTPAPRAPSSGWWSRTKYCQLLCPLQRPPARGPGGRSARPLPARPEFGSCVCMCVPIWLHDLIAMCLCVCLRMWVQAPASMCSCDWMRVHISHGGHLCVIVWPQ